MPFGIFNEHLFGKQTCKREGDQGGDWLRDTAQLVGLRSNCAKHKANSAMRDRTVEVELEGLIVYSRLLIRTR